MSTTAVATKAPNNTAQATRVHRAFTAAIEKRVLVWMAERAPRWLTSDQLTILGLAAQCAAGALFALGRNHHWVLLAVVPCLALNWLGDSLDGTLARVRHHERPRYGFYVDHMMDVFGALALMSGLAGSGLLHWQTAAAMLVAFLVLAAESYLATSSLSRFELSQGIFGPTEVRILLAAGTLAAWHSRFATILGHRYLLFDVGGTIAAAAMLLMAIAVTLRHTAELYRQEPLL